MESRGLKIQISKAWIAKFCKKNHIVRFSLFGSVLSESFSSTSDVDVLIEFDPKHIPGLFGIVKIKEELSKELGREVDLRTAEDISKFFRKEIIERSYLIYEQERLELA